MLLEALHAAPRDAVALTDGARTITYGALPALLQDEVEWLRATDATRFALLADNGVPWALADLALHVSQLFSVPLPASFTPAQHRHALDDAGIDALLTDDSPLAHGLLAGWTYLGRSAVSGLHAYRRSLDTDARPSAPAGTTKVTYTSGSTSTPKGVCLAASTLDAIAGALAGATDSLPIKRHLCVLPLATLLENVAGLYAPLLRGATCIVPSLRVTGMSYGGLDSGKLLATIAREQPHSLILVPELLQVLVMAVERGWTVPASLQFVAVGGAKVSRALLDRADAAGIPVHEGYGLSECASVVCLNTPGARRPGSVGRPLPHVRVRVDSAGQVHVAGNAMLGYLAEAAARPLDEIATGDLGRFDDDGYLHLQGRSGNRFITSFGRNVSPEWIESEVSQRLGGTPVLAWGEAQPFVVLLVGAAADIVPDAAVEAAIGAANASLPDYAQVRRWARTAQPVTFADGTLTANGRLRRAEIIVRSSTQLDALYCAELAS